MPMFKKRRGIHLPYKKQGLIHFICVNYNDMPQEVQDRILKHCIGIAGLDYLALFEVVTNDTKSVAGISKEYNISEKRLYKLRVEFYENW